MNNAETSNPSTIATAASLRSLLVMGTGSIGQRHLMNARALGITELSAFSTGEGIRKEPLPQNLRLLDSLPEAFAGIQAVVIANPTSMHVRSALAAAQAGCHLLIEKPVSHTVEGLDELEAVVRSSKLVAMVGYQFRFHPCLQQVHSWIRQGTIGEIVLAQASWGEYLPAWQPWRDYRSGYAARRILGGGVLLTLSHPIDYLSWLLGRVGSVSCITSNKSGLEIDVEDTALVQCEFAGGAIASIALNYIQRPSSHHLTIVGREGTIRWTAASGTACLESIDGRQVARTRQGFERNDLFLAELNHFLDCVAGICPPACDLPDARRTLQVCLAAMESARTGKKVLLPTGKGEIS